MELTPKGRAAVRDLTLSSGGTRPLKVGPEADAVAAVRSDLALLCATRLAAEDHRTAQQLAEHVVVLGDALRVLDAVHRDTLVLPPPPPDAPHDRN